MSIYRMLYFSSSKYRSIFSYIQTSEKACMGTNSPDVTLSTVIVSLTGFENEAVSSDD